MEKLNSFNRLFDCPLFAHDHAGINDKQLKDYVYNLRDNSKGRIVSNSGGWQSDNVNLKAPELSEFFQTILIDLNFYFEQIGGNVRNKEVMITEAWFNINEKNSFNWSHHHTGFASGVYYIQADNDTGELVLEHPSQTMDLSWNTEWFNETSLYSCSAPTWRVPPETSRFYVFPSWLKHRVEMNTTNKTRISVAINSDIVNRK